MADRDRRFEPKPKHPKHFRTEDGFDLDARVFIHQGDDVGRERLVRYCARPAIVLERLTKLADGRYSYRTKYGRGDRVHRIMTGTELMARIAALVPSPRHPLLRYHGVFAPGHSWRRLVVPKPPTRRPNKLVRVTARVPPEPALTEADADRLLECAERRRRERDAVAQSSPQRPELLSAACVASAAPSDHDDEATSDAPDERAHDAMRSPFILTDEHVPRRAEGAT